MTQICSIFLCNVMNKETELKEFAKDFNNYIIDSTIPLPSAYDWVTSKQKIDDLTAGDSNKFLWRIHDKLYDFSTFHNHPGGFTLLSMTRNTDITELFESCHVNIAKAEALLQKYLVADCKKDKVRNSAVFTFQEKGFYKVLRKKVHEKLSQVRPLSYFHTSAVVHDCLLLLFLVLWIFLVTVDTSSCAVVLGLEIGTGAVLGTLGVCAHTFYHLADTWRTYTLDLSGYSSYEWRISHVLSHHVFPNSVMDYEVMAFEPFLFFLPYRFKHRFLQPLSTALAVLVIFPLVWLASGRISLRGEFLLSPALFLASFALRTFSFPHATWSSSIWLVVARFFMVQSVASWCFLLLGLNATHHHPAIWHSGDEQSMKEYRNAQGEVDWGVYQMVSVGYRPSVDSHWILSSVAFGQHILHHLFPTLDPAYLPLLGPTLTQVCSEFGLLHLIEEAVHDKGSVSAQKQRSFTVWQSFVGMLQQSLRHQPH